jgi:CRISPR-associated endoribonuclease Cas6
MLRAFLLELRPQGGSPLPPVRGYWAHALFLRLIEAVDATLAEALHDQQMRKPYTVAALPAATLSSGGLFTADPDVIWIRLTTLDDSVFEIVAARLLRPPNLRLQLGETFLRVEDVLHHQQQSPLVGCTDFDTLVQGATVARHIEFQFASPTSFNLGQLPSGRRRTSLLPGPGLVIDSLLQKWSAFLPHGAPDRLKPPADMRCVAEELWLPSSYNLHTVSFPLRKSTQSGFIGRCRFRALCDDPEYLRWFNTLADFAFYAGIGARTTMGMGQVRRIDHGV